MKYLFFFLIVLTRLVTASQSLAQGSRQIDSTFKAIQVMKDDTNKINALIDLSKASSFSEPDRSKNLLLTAVKVAKNLKNPENAVAETLMELGCWFNDHDKPDSAEIVLKSALAEAQKLSNPLTRANIESNIGLSFYNRSLHDSAAVYFLKGIKIYEEQKNFSRAALVTNNLAGIYNGLHLYDVAEKTARKAIVLAIKAGDNVGLGKSYMTLANAFYYQSKFDTTSKYFELAVPLLKQDGNPLNLYRIYNNLAVFFKVIKNMKKARLYADSNLALAMKIGTPKGISNAYNTIGDIATKSGDLKSADLFFEKALEYAKIENSFSSFKGIYNNLSFLRIQQGRWEEALDYRILYEDYNDSIVNQEASNKIVELEETYQAERKQALILQLEKEAQIQALTLQSRNTWLIAAFSGIVVLVLFGFLVMRTNRQKQIIQTNKIRQLEYEKQLEASSGILKGQDEERSRLAQDLHDGLGGMLSGLKFSLNNMKGNMILDEENASVFSKSLGQLDNVIAEMRRVAHSMMPEALVRFGLKEASQDLCDLVAKNSGLSIHFQSIAMEVELDKSVSVALYRIEQELLNNIIKHADATEIQVQLVKDEIQISLTVEDNGKGFDVQQVKQGAGLSSIKTRVDALGGRLDIQSGAGNGTSVLIEITV